jgi:hypothetical protein
MGSLSLCRHIRLINERGTDLLSESSSSPCTSLKCSFIARLKYLLQKYRLEREVAKAESEARTARVEANNAINKANQATDTANNAINKADAAIEDANVAVLKANEATERANRAIEVSNASKLTATDALNKSNQAFSTSNKALSEVNSLKTEVSVLKSDNASLKAEIGNLKNQFQGFQNQLDTLRSSNTENKTQIGKNKNQIEETKKETFQEKLQREYRERLDATYKSQEELRRERQEQINEKNKSQSELQQERQNQIDSKINEQISKWDVEYKKIDNRLKEQGQKNNDNEFKNELNNKIKDYEKLNNEQFQKLERKIDSKNFPSVAEIALAVAALDIIKQIATNSNKPTTTCQAPALVPPVGAQVAGVNTAVVGLQGITASQISGVNTTLSNPVTGLPGINTALSHPVHGLAAIQNFASTAWRATGADKVMSALTTVMTIHNGMMLSNNLLSTVSEAANMSLDALGIRDEKDTPIDIGAAVKGKIAAILTSLLGAEQYAALTARIAKANRIYQASTNVLNITRDMMDSARSTAELTCENTGKIGNALLESGVIYEDSYRQMIDKVNPHSKAMKRLERFREGLEVIEQGAETVSEIASNTVEMQENFQELKESKEEWKAANEALTVEKETNSLLSLLENLTNLRRFSQREIKVLTHSDKRELRR